MFFFTVLYVQGHVEYSQWILNEPDGHVDGEDGEGGDEDHGGHVKGQVDPRHNLGVRQWLYREDDTSKTLHHFTGCHSAMHAICPEK